MLKNVCFKTGLIVSIILMLILSSTLLAIEKKGKGKEKAKETEISIDKESTIITLDDLTWLIGHWEGEAFGGVCEEVWSKASGSSMVGTFKLVSEGQVKFYEIITITPDSAGPVMKLKHFNADLTGWEEKDKVITFSFVSASDNMIQFEGLLYERSPDNILEIVVEMIQADGTIAKEVIECHLIED